MTWILPFAPSCGGEDLQDETDTAQTTDSDTQSKKVWECVIDSEETPDSVKEIGCESDFNTLASTPNDSSLPGARSVKIVIDRVDDNALYFQNSNKYRIHYEFASEHLSGVDDLPIITGQESFNENYYSPQRRFILGAVTYYEGPEVWAFEVAPYDTADAAMIETAYTAIARSAYFGDDLFFHPSGQSSEAAAEELGENVGIVTTADLYAGIDYQALNLAKTCGRLVFITAADLEDTYISYRDIVVLDTVPNDISVAQGIITSEFQTPLSHVNVLSQNRGTPNMALRYAFTNEELRALEGEWVIFEVGAFEYTIEKTTKEIADECWIQPEPLGIPERDLTVTDLRDIEELYNPDSEVPLKDQISNAIPAFGGKASHFGALSYVEEANAPKAFAVPLYYYDLFMRENGFDTRVEALLEDETFDADPAYRDQQLEILRNDMLLGTINEDFLAELYEKLNTDYSGIRMRFRSSTNAEDLGDFTGAGLYTSESGQPGDTEDTVEDALRTVWSSIWYFRAFEERSYRGIDHLQVGMALLVHNSFPDEEANGVALTANPFDTSGIEPGFYINVQAGDASVVQPDPGITTDQFIYYFDMEGRPIAFIDHSNLILEGTTVLSSAETHDLGTALKAIHQFFYPAYGPEVGSNEWYAMDVEFKFDDDFSDTVELSVKQARPHPGR